MKLVQIWRYPIKSHGSENLETIDILNGKALPLDRKWAVIHDQSEADGLTWVPCRNFSRVAKAPQLAAISANWISENKLEPAIEKSRNGTGKSFLCFVGGAIFGSTGLPLGMSINGSGKV